MKKTTNRMDSSIAEQVQELLYQALETELGGVEVYRTALACVRKEGLRAEWRKYLAQTEEHVRRLRGMCEALGLDPDTDTPGRQVVRTIGKALVQAMTLARGTDQPDAAQLVAAECVVHAETKDHLNWSLIGMLAKKSSGELAGELAAAHAEIEGEEDEHYYHGVGWARELWLQALGIEAEIPPPEEQADVRSAEDAVRVKKDSKKQRALSQER